MISLGLCQLALNILSLYPHSRRLYTVRVQCTHRRIRLFLRHLGPNPKTTKFLRYRRHCLSCLLFHLLGLFRTQRVGRKGQRFAGIATNVVGQCRFVREALPFFMTSEGGGVERIGRVDVDVVWIGSFIFDECPYFVCVFIGTGVHGISNFIVWVAIIGGIIYYFVLNSLTNAQYSCFVEIRGRGPVATRCPPSYCGSLECVNLLIGFIELCS
mmetsp:Transcript_32941/g.69340  ORF Transcript_32941/g.69340 Transcript_32941/m.69340 type:complete len:213 (+) Transcript_32941:674-1312(+)